MIDVINELISVITRYGYLMKIHGIEHPVLMVPPEAKRVIIENMDKLDLKKSDEDKELCEQDREIIGVIGIIGGVTLVEMPILYRKDAHL
jgi:hypothetical protein